MTKTEELLNIIRENPSLFETALKLVAEQAQAPVVPQSKIETKQ